MELKIVVQEGTIFTPTEGNEKIENIINAAKKSNIEIVTLTPYY